MVPRSVYRGHHVEHRHLLVLFYVIVQGATDRSCQDNAARPVKGGGMVRELCLLQVVVGVGCGCSMVIVFLMGGKPMSYREAFSCPFSVGGRRVF